MMGQINDKEKDRFDEIVDKQLLHNSMQVRPDFQRIHALTDFSRFELTRLYTGFKETAPNGSLTEDQFIEGFAICFPHGDPEPYAKHVFRTTDTSGKGYLTFEDVAVCIHVLTRSENLTPKLNWIFRLYDADGDGLLSAQNLAEILISIYLLNGLERTMATESAQKHIASLPIYQAINTETGLTETEFIAACSQNEELMSALTAAVDSLNSIIF